MSLLGSILGAGVQGVAFDNLLDDLTTHRSEVQDRLVGAEPTIHPQGITGEIRDTAGFTPWGVSTRGLGESSFGAGGQLTSNLAPNLEDYSNEMRGLARATGQSASNINPALANFGAGLTNQSQNMFNDNKFMAPKMSDRAANFYRGSRKMLDRSMQPVGAREADVYERIRATQRPEEQRQMESMQANLFGTGRGGMMSDAYGGSPEEFAYNKARGESMNQASLNAMSQAQQEMMNQGQLAESYGNLGGQTYQVGLQQQELLNQIAQQKGALGLSAYETGYQGQQTAGQLSGMFGDSMLNPYNVAQQQAQLGLQGSQLQNENNQQLASLLSQMGIGGLTTDVNYANVIGGVYGKMAEAAGTAATATGDWLSSIEWGEIFN